MSAAPLEDRQRSRTGERNQPAVAQLDRALGRARIAFLTDGHELAAFDHEASVARGVLRAKAKHHDRRSFGKGLTYPGESLRPNEWRIAENHEHVIGCARNRGFCGQHGMSGSTPLRLHEDL